MTTLRTEGTYLRLLNGPSLHGPMTITYYSEGMALVATNAIILIKNHYKTCNNEYIDLPDFLYVTTEDKEQTAKCLREGVTFYVPTERVVMFT